MKLEVEGKLETCQVGHFCMTSKYNLWGRVILIHLIPAPGASKTHWVCQNPDRLEKLGRGGGSWHEHALLGDSLSGECTLPVTTGTGRPRHQIQIQIQPASCFIAQKPRIIFPF